MYNRKTLKKNARYSIKKNYFHNVIVVFICTLLLTGGFNYTTKNVLHVPIENENNKIINNVKLSNSEIIEDLLGEVSEQKKVVKNLSEKCTRGVISYFINETTQKRSFTFSIMNGINKLVFEGKIGTSIIIFLSSVVFLIFSILFINTLEVGKNRYFLEERRYYKTKIDRLLFPYKVKKTFHIAYILFVKYVYQLLWNFTIIGGIIKYYEYKMIPYILAENPTLSKKEVFKLSKELAYGNKWDLFCTDLSMIGWSILKLFTFNLSGIFYSNIYIETLYAEIYMNLRKNKKNKIDKENLLNDKSLELEDGIYDVCPSNNLYKGKTRKWLNINYNRDYDVKTYILFFFTFSIVGWLWEVFLQCFNTGEIVNRGTMYGPWLPIYGYGGLLILILLKKYRNKPHILFILAFLLCGVIEYSTAWYLETFKHLRYWDYSGYFLNIQGRICLEGLLLFGISGCFFTYVVAPILDNLYQKINSNVKTIICIVLLIGYITDFVFTSISPNTGKGVSKPVYSEER